MNNELAVRESVKAEISGFEMKPRTLKEAMDFCEIMANSDLVPSAYKGKPGNIMVAIQMGSELGLSPMRALRSIAVINGRASMWGDDVLAMVLASPVCEYVDESASNEKQGVCKTKRKGCDEQISIFTLEDAKRAGLLGKQGPWQTNTGRMLKLRARGFGLRDTFADVLAGLVSAEEALDMPRIEPEDPATNILEAGQPLTLKDKLKAKVDATDETLTPRQEDGAGPDSTQGLPQQASDAPATEDDPAEPYRARIRTAHDEKEAKLRYDETPETLKQDVHQDYFDHLKELGKRKQKVKA